MLSIPEGNYDRNSLPYKDKTSTVADGKDYTDILSPEAKQHILYGDSHTSGGHIFPGNPGKATFPSNWTAEKIVHEVGDIATSPVLNGMLRQVLKDYILVRESRQNGLLMKLEMG